MPRLELEEFDGPEDVARAVTHAFAKERIAAMEREDPYAALRDDG